MLVEVKPLCFIYQFPDSCSSSELRPGTDGVSVFFSVQAEKHRRSYEN
jgi:hypothetical protein